MLKKYRNLRVWQSSYQLEGMLKEWIISIKI